MPAQIPADSVGLVTPQTVTFPADLQLECGRSLPGYTLVYESYGALNKDQQ